jgi:hypothetical protein
MYKAVVVVVVVVSWSKNGKTISKLMHALYSNQSSFSSL